MSSISLKHHASTTQKTLNPWLFSKANPWITCALLAVLQHVQISKSRRVAETADSEQSRNKILIFSGKRKKNCVSEVANIT